MDLNQKTVQMTLIVVFFVMCQFWTGFTCPAICQCCLNDNCGNPTSGYWNGWSDVCLDGCKDGYHQARCLHTCPGNCHTCKQDDGACLTCIPGFYDISSNCLNSCSHKNCACDHTSCDYCLNGFYNISNDCNLVCSKGCHNGKCKDDGTCVCIANFEKDKCDFCVQGKYGDRCNNSCVNENCSCTNATDCVSCQSGYFDFSTLCSKQCSLGCKNVCENDGTCKCLSQFTGPQCRNCLNGYFGNDCKTPCSGGCINGTCNIDGTCQCLPNYDGNMCDICDAGHFGDYCDIKCGSGCTNNICDRYGGTCECEFNYKGSQCNMCKDGYFGSHCSLICSDRCYNCSSIENCFTCKEGFYGFDCSLTCAANCLQSRCEKYDGFCTDGCVGGLTAGTCNAKCDSICKTCSQTNSSDCTSCFGGFRGPGCKCFPNCRCELNSVVCNECTNGFEMKSKNCKCNRNNCLNSSHCTSCQNNTFYTYGGTCCECHTHCKNKQCSSETHCLSGCEDGYTGEDCADLCKDYDTNCMKCNQIEHFCVNCESGFSPNTESVCARQCSDTCFNKECDDKTGRCLQGCDERYWGHNCNHSCHPSCTSCLQENGTCTQCVNKSLISVGNSCTRQCSETCVNKVCDDKTGQCLQGCIRNFYADKCDLICPSTCASKLNKTSCDNYGRCLHGCMEGYKGVTCASATKTPKSDSSVGGLIGGTVGGASTIVSVVIVIVVFLYLKRRKLHKKPSESGGQSAFRNPSPFAIEEQEMYYQQLSDRHNTTTGIQDETYTELQTSNMEYELVEL